MKTFRLSALALLPALVACGTPPKSDEVVWAVVAQTYTLENLKQARHALLAQRVREAGLSERDVEAGRVVRIACGVGTNYAWGSDAYLPAGMGLSRDQVLEVAVKDAGNDERPGWNAVLGAAAFSYPGTARAYRFIPDWKERGLSHNLEPLALAPGQRGRYVESHSNYLIKCRPPR